MPNKPKSEAQGIQLSYRYRIYPTPEQEKALAFEFDACRYVYNHFLRARTESWERTQKTLRRPKWTCHECGAQHDRKANGAQNVLEAGKDILAKQEQSFVTKAKRSREKKRAK